MSIGFFELVVIFIVIVLFLGPDKAPQMLRWLGLYYRKVKAGWYNMQDNLERELHLDVMQRHASVQKQDSEADQDTNKAFVKTSSLKPYVKKN